MNFLIIPRIESKTILIFTSRSHNGNNSQGKLCCETTTFGGAPTLLRLLQIFPGILHVDTRDISVPLRTLIKE